jgi:hypothetical protein
LGEAYSPGLATSLIYSRSGLISSIGFSFGGFDRRLAASRC